MRTPLNLGVMKWQGLLTSPKDGAWVLTAEGVAQIAEDRALSDW